MGLDEDTLGSLYDLKSRGRKSKAHNSKKNKMNLPKRRDFPNLQRFMFMNSRGLRNLAKHLHIASCVRDHNLDFVASSEVGRRDFLVNVLN